MHVPIEVPSRIRQQIGASAATATLPNVVRLRGSRSALTASYRLAASVPVWERDRVVGLAALLSTAGREHEMEKPGDFELAARSCLAALYVRVALGPFVLAAAPLIGLDTRSNGSGSHAVPEAVPLRLECIRAVSAKEVEYVLRPFLAGVPDEARVLGGDGRMGQQVFELMDFYFEKSHGVTIVATSAGSEKQLAQLPHSALPEHRKEYVDKINHLSDGGLWQLEDGLLGLDEWQFAGHLRIAFSRFTVRMSD